MKLDNTDIQILNLLTDNARMQWKDIGETIHMSGQAVGNRIRRMEEEGIIKSYTLNIDEDKLNDGILGFLTMYMNSAHHGNFIDFINMSHDILEAHRISGEGCYHLKFRVKTKVQLNDLLQKLLAYGNYSLNISVHQLKTNHKFIENDGLDNAK
ncbi:Lrp/AsnC family transcriptional regulator [Staphylococcus succinus]|uniref:Lrp/AsnC family transcriptional regulator n=1 Tax=Staphylococcus succinus TaxID=61015 RepID=UPI000E679F46|nr:Lrp/AsnC family transcriptional regulator [Staphylococcus succinus]RIN40467.1 Lrp/AsnC family transcriptional regulator [Staphylococcus succinus]